MEHETQHSFLDTIKVLLWKFVKVLQALNAWLPVTPQMSVSGLNRLHEPTNIMHAAS